jgi:hypothetical protein
VCSSDLGEIRLDSYNYGMGRIEFLEWFEQFKNEKNGN